jgi:hypothetical protein
MNAESFGKGETVRFEDDARADYHFFVMPTSS